MRISKPECSQAMPEATSTPFDGAALKQRIKDEALALGFDAVGFGPASIPDRNHQRYLDFVAQGQHGTMGWMENRLEQRADPKTLWDEARSAVVVGLNYGPDEDPLNRLDQTERANFSVYAENRDYHDILKKRLKRLGRWIGEETGQALKVFVDTAPVPEKALAAQTWVGWQGKHTNLVSSDFGSWLFLGVIYLSFDLPADEASADQCGSCTRCIDICPTAAIPAPYTLDATRCLAYLSIEHEGAIPVEFRKAMGNRIYGCDDCLAVCPWNKFAQATKEAGFKPREVTNDPRLLDFVDFDDAQFRAAFSGSPIKRIGIRRFLRNLAICLGNSGQEKTREPLKKLARHEDPVVAESAAWALDQLP